MNVEDMRYMDYLDALDYVAEEIVKEYTIEEKNQLCYDAVYTHLEKNHTHLVGKALEMGVIIYDE
jgi:hypothetical protein